jgi:N-ethylmaleimide reductase
MNQTAQPVLQQAAWNERANGLFAPVRVGGWLLRNRIVMAPMTRQRAGAGDVAGPLQAAYYAQRASAGLIVTEGSQVSPQGRGYIATPGIHSAAQVEGWRQTTHAVHAAGGRIVVQLWHVGRVSHPSLQPDGALPVAPSALAAPGMAETADGTQPFPVPRALALEEIPGLVEQFRRAAENAMSAGFDGVELHAGNGYLIDQFLRESTNRRADGYGGPIANRARFLLEVTDAVCGVCGPSRVGVRVSPINPWGGMADSDPAALFGHVARALSTRGIAYLHVAESRTRRPMFSWSRLRRQFRGCYIAGGGFDRYRADAALRRGRADLISFARDFIANPDLPERLLLGAPARQADPGVYYRGDARGYADFAPMTPAERRAIPPYSWRRAALAWVKWW